MAKGSTYYLKTDSYRLLTSWKFYGSMLLLALAMVLSLESRDNIGESVITIFFESISRVGNMLTFIVCAIPFASVYTDELETKYVCYSAGRGNLKKYVLSKSVVIMISSIIVFVAGALLFSLFFHIWFPWSSEEFINMVHDGIAYEKILTKYGVCPWILLWAFQSGMKAGCFSLLSAYVSLYISNRMLVLIMPAVLNQLMNELQSGRFGNIPMLCPNFVFDASVRIFSEDWMEMAWALIFAVCMTGIVFAATYVKIRKRV